MNFDNIGPAIYLQIADFICEKILLGEWLPDDKIPSVRELAMQVEVNPNTVARTYEFLKQQEIIYDKRGVGYFVVSGGKKKALEFRKKEFMDKESSRLFRTLFMLGLTPCDLEKEFSQYLKRNHLTNK